MYVRFENLKHVVVSHLLNVTVDCSVLRITRYRHSSRMSMMTYSILRSSTAPGAKLWTGNPSQIGYIAPLVKTITFVLHLDYDFPKLFLET